MKPNNSLNEINKKLETKEREKAELIFRGKADIKATRERIEELESKLEDPESLEDYNKTAQELENAKKYLDYIVKASGKANTSSALSEDEYKAIKSFIVSEVEAKQKEAAPKLQAKLLELIDMMNEYSADVSEYEATLNKALGLYAPKTTPSMYFRGDIRHINPDRLGWWGQFCTMYFQYRETARKLSTGATRDHWGRLVNK